MKRILLFTSLLLITGSLVMAQTVQISGTVTGSEDGLAMPGVNVTVKGTTIGAITDADGKYTIIVPANAQSLLFSFVGFVTAEVPIEGKTRIDLVLQQDLFRVDEIVVVGYGTQKKREVTGSISAVKGDDLRSLAAGNFAASLAGRSTGVQITQQTGVLGEEARFRIRGVGSISSGTYPLIVLDGVPIATGDMGGQAAANSLGSINPSDIESMEILKDGSATAIYGSLAANGVILITTRRGSAGKMKVNYNSYYGVAQPIRLFDLLKADDFVMISNEKYTNRGYAPVAFNDGAAFPGQTFDTDWQMAVLRKNAFQMDHNLSLSGGTDINTYYFSLGYSSMEGVTRPNEMERFSVRANLEQKVRKWLTVGTNIGVSRTKYLGLNTGANSLSGNIFSAIRQLPNTPVYNPDHPTGYNIDDIVYPDPIGTGNPDWVGRWNNVASIGENIPNIRYVIDHNKFTSDVYRILGNAFAQVNILKTLNFKTQLGIDHTLTEGLYYYNPLHGDGRAANGRIYNDSDKTAIWNLQNILTYNQTFLNDHNVTLTLVNEFQFQRYNGFNAAGTDLSNVFFSKNVISGTYGTQISGGSMTERGWISYAGRFNYNFRGKYYLQGSLRYDGLSSLADKWGLFPGASVGWTVTQEPFMSSVTDILSDLKIRASYAKVGNSNIGNYPYLGLYGSAKYANYNGLGFSQLGNAELQWETSTKYDIGFDALFLEGKYKLTFDYFLNDQDGLILDAPLPPSLGIPRNVVSRNIGSMKNWGYEISGEAFIIRNNDLTWSVDANITFQKNEVTSLYQDKDMTYDWYINRVGESYNSIFGWEYAGVNAANGNTLYYKADGSIIQGNIANSAWRTYDPEDPANVSNPASAMVTADKRIIGPSIPTYFGGLNTKAQYKGLDLLVSTRFSGGNYIFNRTRVDLLGLNFTNNGAEILGRWQSPEEPGDGWTPKLWSGGTNFINQPEQGSTRWIEKGNFFKFSTVALGYTFPKEWMRKIHVDNLRVYVQGQDMLMITKYTGIDPEMEITGRDFNGTPKQRVITFGINLSL